MNKIFKKNWGMVLVLILSFWAISPLFHSGFFPMHDDTQVARVYEMAQALRDGQFPVRWVADLGYGFGYPLFNFYAPLPYYAGAIFNLVGLDVLWATKIMFLLGILLSGLFTYLLARDFFGELGGILAGLFYVYAPYHALDIYVRGAVGEFWAMAFLPLMVWGFYRVGKYSVGNGNLIAEKSKVETSTSAEASTGNQNSKMQLKIKNDVWKWVIVAAIGYAGVILSHNLTAIMVTPFLGIGLLGYWIIGLLGKRKTLRPTPYTLYPLFLGLGLSTFYWLPAIWEMQFTNVASQIGGGADFHDHFVCLTQLWDSPWGFGGSAPGCTADGLSFKVGKLHLILSFISFALSLFWWRQKTRNTAIFMATGYLLLAIFMVTQYSKFIWEVIAPMAYLQYPWRFLIIATLASSFLVGSIFLFLKNRFLSLLIFLLLLLSLLLYNVKYFKPQEYLGLSAQDYTSEENIKWKTSKTSDEFLPIDFPKPQNPNQVAKEKIVSLDKFTKISDLKIKANRYSFNIVGENENFILTRVAFFPGWKVFVDGKEKLFLVRGDQMFFATPKGKHQVEVIFTNTPARSVGNILSLLSAAILFGGFLYGRKKVKS